MKKFTVTAVSFSAVLGCLALAATASANHGTRGSMLSSGKDSGKTEISTEKGDGGHLELNAVELATFGKKDGG
ncbi:MAG: hypothetical protein ABI461_12570 [Polyangiaceae bacterium]